MATNAYVELEIPEAADLADYTGIEYDLRSAREFVRLLRQELAKDPPNHSVVQPITIAILVQYSRPFASGVRKPLGEEALAALTPDQRAKHDRLRTIRDRYVAHSVNSFEESRPQARYWVERVKDEGITSISCSHHRVIGLGAGELDDVVELTTALLEYVGTRLAAERERVLNAVRQMPLEKVLIGVKQPIVPDISDPGKSRKPRHPTKRS